MKCQFLKPLWLCSSSAISAAIVLSASPALAEGQRSTLSAADPAVTPNAALEFGALRLPELSSQILPTASDAESAEAILSEAVLGRENLDQESREGSNEAVLDELPEPASVQPLPASPLTDSAEALTEPSIESTDLAPLDSIVQTDIPDRQPAEPAPDLQPSDPSAEPQPAESEDAESENAESENAESEEDAVASGGWQFSLSPYFFAPFDVQTDVTVAGRSTSLELGLDDVLNLDRAFDAGLRLEGQNDRWGFIVDGFYLFAKDSGRLGRTFSSGSIFQFVQQTSPGRLQEFAQQFEPQQIQQFVQIGQQIGLNTPIGVTADGSASVRQITIDAAVSYRVVDAALDSSPEGGFYPRLVVAPLVGLRTNFLRQTVEVDTIRINNTPIPDEALPRLDRDFRVSRTLVEPLLGAQIELALSERWAFGLRGDVSGFNIGADQNFTWNLIAATRYNLSRSASLQLAYRFNSFDFEDGEGLRRTRLDLRQNGLLLNAIFRF